MQKIIFTAAILMVIITSILLNAFKAEKTAEILIDYAACSYEAFLNKDFEGAKDYINRYISHLEDNKFYLSLITASTHVDELSEIAYSIEAYCTEDSKLLYISQINTLMQLTAQLSESEQITVYSLI